MNKKRRTFDDDSELQTSKITSVVNNQLEYIK